MISADQYFSSGAGAVEIVVPVSGGKDSQACLKLAVETGRPVLGVFCDTQFEHPWTYQHIEYLEFLYSVKIVKIGTSSVDEQVLKYNRFPGGGARHCTEYLKLRESKLFYTSLAFWKFSPFQVWCGMRSDESPERTKRYAERISTETYPPHELFPGKYPKFLERWGVMFCLPILDWVTDEVFEFIGAGHENPLYRAGFTRVGCFPCLAGGDASMIKAFEFDEFGASQRRRVQALSDAIGRSCFRSGIGKKYDEYQGCAMCAI